MAKAALRVKRDQYWEKRGEKLPDGRLVRESQGNRMEMGRENAIAADITQLKSLEEASKNWETRLRQSSQIILAHERERKGLSQELQDSILSKLLMIKSTLEKKIALLGEFSAERLELEKLKLITQGAAEGIRRITTNLYPAISSDLGFLGGVNYFLADFQKLYSHAHISKEIRLQESDVPNHLRIVISRVLQEALNNFIKHGHGDQVYAVLKKKGGEIKLLIEDNGIGFTPENSKKCLGLDSMRGRVELSGDVFKVESAKGKGTTIRASWPC